MTDELRKNDGDIISRYLPGLSQLSSSISEKVLAVWIHVKKKSDYLHIEDFPYSVLAPQYRLMDHVKEVGEIGLALADTVKVMWGLSVDIPLLVQALLLHDIDKPLMYFRNGEKVEETELAKEIPHGVLGGLILKEFDFSDELIYLVSTHSAQSPFHGNRVEGYVLHYADFISADHAIMKTDNVPFYQKHFC
jgi:putative nucleotidyltransferase with HDIG domain